MTILWSNVLIPRSVSFRIHPLTQKGPPSFSGRPQVGAPDAGYWVATLSGFVLGEPEQLLEWRGIVASLQGGLEDVMISPYDHLNAPLVDGFPAVINGIPHSDGAYFSDGSGYSQTTIKVALQGGLGERATRAVFRVIEAGLLKRGHYFSIGRRMYMLTHAPEYEGNLVSVRFLPPLREAAIHGVDIDFADPRLLMTVESVDTGDMEIDLHIATTNISLMESYNGLS